MNYKKNIYKILFIPLFIFLGLIIIYLFFPKLFFYRGWEFFNTLAYQQNEKLSYTINESGDASRDYIIQKYSKNNKITINKYGNRVACYDPKKKKSILILGASQTFGSGLDDVETLPKLLCNYFKDTSIYNGARRHGILLNKAKNLQFNKILFISPERFGFRGYCNSNNINSYLIKNFDEDRFELNKINYLNFLGKQIKYLNFYLQKRSEIILNPNYNIFSPNDHILMAKHSYSKDTKYKEFDCIKKLNKLFTSNNYEVGFMYFPGKQTILYKKLNVTLEDETKNFIPKMTKLMQLSGIPTYDTKKCIDEKLIKSNTEIYSYHDTHLTFNGIKTLYNCLINSDVKKLFN